MRRFLPLALSIALLLLSAIGFAVTAAAQPALDPAAVRGRADRVRSEPESVPVPTPAPAAEGVGRSNPAPFGSTLRVGDWEFGASEVVRGGDAWARISDANMFNDPPLTGYEYALVRVRVKYLGGGEADVDGNDFWITGSSGLARGPASVVEPSPDLDATLLSGGEAEGWVAFEIAEDEANLMLIGFGRFIALEPGAQVIPDWIALPTLSRVGSTRAVPAALGNQVVTSKWEVGILDMVRGEAALAAIQEANQFNDPPDEGFEYVLVRVRARNVSWVDYTAEIDEGWFRINGNAGVLYAGITVVEPRPRLQAHVFPGGEVEGWAAFQVSQSDTGLMLRFNPPWAQDSSEVRYLALDAGAGVPARAAPLAEATSLGSAFDSPVPFGQKATTDTFEIEAVEAVRGSSALEMVRAASSYNDPPAAGMEYVVVRLRVRNVSAVRGWYRIDESSFRLVGTQRSLWDRPYVVDPWPELSADLYSGGVAEGWVTLQAAADEADLRVVYQPPYTSGGMSRRYLALP